MSPTPCHSLPRPTGTSEQLRKLWTRWPRSAGRQRPAETAACKVFKRRFLVWDVFHGVKSSKTLRFQGPSGSQKVLLNPFEPMPRQGALARRCFASASLPCHAAGSASLDSAVVEKISEMYVDEAEGRPEVYTLVCLHGSRACGVACRGFSMCETRITTRPRWTGRAARIYAGSGQSLQRSMRSGPRQQIAGRPMKNTPGASGGTRSGRMRAS